MKIIIVAVYAYEIYKVHFQKHTITSFDALLATGSVVIAVIFSRSDRIKNANKGNFDYTPEEANQGIKRILLWLLAFLVFLICFYFVIRWLGKS